MSIKVDEKKLEELHLYFTKEKGSTELEAVMKKIGTTDEAVKDAYVDALREKYPKIYPKKEEEAPAPKVPEFTYMFTNEQGFSEPLEVIGIQNQTVFLKKIVPTDIVTVKLGGKDVQFDLLQVEKEAVRLGVDAKTLKVLGTAAKG